MHSDPYSQTSKHVSELQRIRAIRLLLTADLKTHEWARVVCHESKWQRPSQIHILLQESKVRCTSLECEAADVLSARTEHMTDWQ